MATAIVEISVPEVDGEETAPSPVVPDVRTTRVTRRQGRVPGGVSRGNGGHTVPGTAV